MSLLKKIGLLSVLLFASTLQAAPASTDVPAALQPWIDWVGHEQEFRRCPALWAAEAQGAQDFYCAWPGTLFLKVNARGAKMNQQWKLDAPSWVDLPGDRDNWPQHVLVNGKAHPVLMHEDLPALYLPTGTYQISADWTWTSQERPEQMTVPESIGLVQLTLEDKAINPVERNGSSLRLGAANSEAPRSDNSLNIQVHRKLTDGLPALLVSYIDLEVSGTPREVVIGPVLLEGFEPMALSSHWPAQWLPDRRIKVQLQAGKNRIELQARALTPLAKLTVNLPSNPTDANAWAEQEIWSYQDQPTVRSTALQAANAQAKSIDPQQAQVPEEWRTLPAFALQSGAVLNVEQRGRGLSENARNKLSLQRDLWLNFDGAGFFARDLLRGDMRQGWRLDVAAPYKMERASEASSLVLDSSEPFLKESLLITQGEQPQWSGVEWRSPSVVLDASLRLAREGVASSLPINGWQQTLDTVATDLHLPAGYRLIAAQGVDRASGSWLDRWNLLDVFYAAFVVLLALRWLGRKTSLVVAAYWILAIHEWGAPQWSLGIALALGLALKALAKFNAKAQEGAAEKHKNSLQKTLWMGAGVVLIVLIGNTLAFVPEQLRSALHPQLERGFGLTVDRSVRFKSEPVVDPTEEVMAAAAPISDAEVSGYLGKSKKSMPKNEEFMLEPTKEPKPRYSPATLLQTGAPQPQWNLNNNYRLSWSGPVVSDQTMRLLICPPWLTRVWRVLMVLLLGFSVLRMGQSWWRQKPVAKSENLATPASSGASSLPAVFSLVSALVLCSALGMSSPAQAAEGVNANFPPEEMLTELGQRLQAQPKCWPTCASVSRAELRWQSANTFVLGMEWHVGATLALPLSTVKSESGTATGVSLQGVRVDGQSSAVGGLNGVHWLSLTRGVHWVELSYTLHGQNATLQFPTPSLLPLQINVASQTAAWSVEGIDEGRLLNDTLQFTRQEREVTNGKSVAVQSFSPYVRVTRELNLGLEWTVTTTVERLTRNEGGLSLNIPLIKGEHVTSAGIKVQEGQALVSLPSGEDLAVWRSRLDKTEQILLTAPALGERAERWLLNVGSTWHATPEGVPVDASNNMNNEGAALTQFSALPGETLKLTLRQPPALAGATRTIDQVFFALKTGARASTYSLRFNLRTSQGGEHVITLPTGADALELLQVSRNDEALNLQVRDGKLSLPVMAGEQVFTITLRGKSDLGWLGFYQKSPVIDLGLPSANISLGWDQPSSRWLLAASGPAQGSAILWWGELLIALILGGLIAKSGVTGLKLTPLLLLVLGFSTFSWSALLAVLLWLAVMKWRANQSAQSPYHAKALRFNFAQCGLVVLTAIALSSLVAAIPFGLLAQPDMRWMSPSNPLSYELQQAGGDLSNAYAQLSWFADTAAGALPNLSVYSLPMWCYRGAMLLWSLWLAVSVFKWLKAGFTAWSTEGYWKKIVRTPKPKK